MPEIAAALIATTLINEAEAAKCLGFSVKTLQARRHKGQPPKFYKIGTKTVRYSIEDLKAFIADGARTNTIAGMV